MLGIDPGLENAAWALVTLCGFPKPVAWHRTRKNKDAAMGPHLKIALKRGCVLAGFIEDQFVKLNPRSATQLAHQAGAWAEACRDQGLRAFFIPPSQWQGAELCHGPKFLTRKTTKERAIERCQLLWGLTDISEHEADALLIARYAAIQHTRRPWWR